MRGERALGPGRLWKRGKNWVLDWTDIDGHRPGRNLDVFRARLSPGSARADRRGTSNEGSRSAKLVHCLPRSCRGLGRLSQPGNPRAKWQNGKSHHEHPTRRRRPPLRAQSPVQRVRAELGRAPAVAEPVRPNGCIERVTDCRLRSCAGSLELASRLSTDGRRSSARWRRVRSKS